jgi:hypothetical protein
MTDSNLARVTFGPISSSSAGYLQIGGGSYYHGRIEFLDDIGTSKAIIKSDEAVGLYLDMRSNATGILFTRSGGVPVFLFTPSSEIKDSAGNLLLSQTTLGPNVVTSSLTQLGTLNSLSILGSVTSLTGSFNSINGTYKVGYVTVLNGTTLGSTVVNSSLTTVGTLASLAVTGDLTVDTSTLKVDSTNNRVGVVNASPAYPLDVVGDCNLSTGSKYKINGVDILTGFVNDLSPITLDKVNSRVGVNQVSPTCALDVTGAANISTNLTVGGYIDLV